MYELSIDTTMPRFDDLNSHLKVILAYVLIPMSNISQIIYDMSAETETANKKWQDSF